MELHGILEKRRQGGQPESPVGFAGPSSTRKETRAFHPKKKKKKKRKRVPL
jgi:hypothetical protein